MKWMGRSRSGNIDDRRGMSSGGKFLAGGGIIGGIALLAQMFIGGDTGRIIGQIANQVQVNNGTEQRDLTPEELQQQEFVDVVLNDVDSIWTKILSERGEDYKRPTMVLFTDGVQTECGGASSATGPFYCPADQKVYMDLSFMNELTDRFGAKGGDFATAYIIAHEVGHHVQNLLGTSEEMQQAQQGLSKAQANKLSVGLELQADFYAGIFAHYDKHYLDLGDIEEALSAANAVGDDAIQKKTQGRIVPDAFTHGTSAQRVYWFKKGFETGDISQGDTFSQLAN